MPDTTTLDSSLDFPGAEALLAAGRVAPPSAQTVDRALAAVLAAAEAEQAVQAEPQPAVGTELLVTPLPRRRFLSGRRLLAIAVAAAVAAGVVVAAGVSGSPRAGDERAGRAQQAVGANDTADVLDQLASVAATQPASSAPYWRMQLRNFLPAGTKDDIVFLSRTGVTYPADGGKSHIKFGVKPIWEIGAKQVGWNGLDQLPTDPATLLSMMSTGFSPGQRVFAEAGSILGAAPASPALRAGLFKALKRLPGVRVIGTVADATGRRGIEIRYHGPMGTEAFIVDPRTAIVLESTFAQAGHDVRTVYLSVGPAMSLS